MTVMLILLWLELCRATHGDLLLKLNKSLSQIINVVIYCQKLVIIAKFLCY